MRGWRCAAACERNLDRASGGRGATDGELSSEVSCGCRVELHLQRERLRWVQNDGEALREVETGSGERRGVHRYRGGTGRCQCERLRHWRVQRYAAEAEARCAYGQLRGRLRSGRCGSGAAEGNYGRAASGRGAGDRKLASEDSGCRWCELHLQGERLRWVQNNREGLNDGKGAGDGSRVHGDRRGSGGCQGQGLRRRCVHRDIAKGHTGSAHR